MPDGLDRLKVLINSSTPIVVMETSEEMRAVSLVRAACSQLNMATFEWSIADGLVRSGSNAPAENHRHPSTPRADQPGGGTRVSTGSLAQPHTVLSPGAGESERLTRSLLSALGTEAASARASGSIFNTREPVQALANMEAMTVEAVFILKDL